MSERVLVGCYSCAKDLVSVATAIRQNGNQIIGVYTPFSVPELERVLSLRPSKLPWFCFLLGLIGAGLKVWFEFWTSATDWPLNVGGKPWNSLLAFIPVTFEVMVLFAGVGTAIAFLLRQGLYPRVSPPRNAILLEKDHFVLAVKVHGSKESREGTAALLESYHPISVIEEVFTR